MKENSLAADIDDTSDQISNHSLTFEDMMKAVKEENCDEAMGIIESPTTLDDAYKLLIAAEKVFR